MRTPSEKKRKKKEEEREGGLNPERLVAYKWLKLIEAIVLIVIGVIFACFCNNADFTRAVGYGFAVILLVYGLIEIVGSLLIRRSVFSSDVLLGLIVIAVSVLLLVYSGALAENASQFNEIITWFFGILIGGYALMLIASGVLDLLPKEGERKRTLRAVLVFVSAALLIGLDVTLWIFGFRQESEVNPVLVITIALSMILMGGIAIGNVVLASRTQKLLKEAVSRAPEESASITPHKGRDKKASKAAEPAPEKLEEFDATAQLTNSDED